MKFVETDERIITVPRFEDCLVYLLLNDGEVVYVGQTRNGLARPLSHRDKDFNEIKILYCDETELDALEDKFIHKYNPIYNKQNNYAIRWGLLRVRNCVRKQVGIKNYTLPMLKRLLKELNIKPELDNYTGQQSITLDEYKTVVEHLRSNENGGK